MAKPYDQTHVRRDGLVWKRIGGQSLCGVCGALPDCNLSQALRTLGGQKNATVLVERCGGYLPVVSFQDCTGLEGRFNTFRRGRGWANRVVLSGRVGIFDLAGKTMIGTARVERVESGPLGEMLAAYASMNHLMKAWPVQQTPALLHKVLRRLYGNTYASESAEFSVIEMQME